MKLLDLRSRGGWYVFRFGGGDDFWIALEELKRRIPPQQRNYDAELNHQWSVEITDFNRDVLMDTFENGKHAITMIENQLCLSGMEDYAR